MRLAFPPPFELIPGPVASSFENRPGLNVEEQISANLKRYEAGADGRSAGSTGSRSELYS